MKIWHQHGSEHSANLVMIGRFKNDIGAAKAKEIIDALTKQVREEEEAGTRSIGNPSDQYGRAMLDLLSRLNIMAIGPNELEQFAYEVTHKAQGNEIILTTEETDVSAFLKVMFQQGARVEVYSAHDYPDATHGRGR